MLLLFPATIHWSRGAAGGRSTLGLGLSIAGGSKHGLVYREGQHRQRRSAGQSISLSSSISADGRYVAFYSDASNLVDGDTDILRDILLKDLLTGETTRSAPTALVSRLMGTAKASISADGRYVAFSSYASNLVAATPTAR